MTDMDILDYDSDGVYHFDPSENSIDSIGDNFYDSTTIYDDPNAVVMAGHDMLYADGSHVSFLGGENSDGYKHKGSVYLERTISGIEDKFEHYVKGTIDYVKVHGRYIPISGGGTVTIDNIKYDKP